MTSEGPVHDESLDFQAAQRLTRHTVLVPLFFGFLFVLGLIFAVDYLLAATRALDHAEHLRARDTAIMLIVSTCGLAVFFAGAMVWTGYRRAQQLSAAYSQALAAQRRLEELRVVSLQDALTGLLNVRGLMAFGRQVMRMAARDKTQVWCMFLDMDGLKQINDTFGHDAGSRAITDIAGAIKQATRRTDLVARLGGDEFVVMGCAAELPAQLVIDRLNAELARLNGEPGRPYRLEVSYGVVSEPVEDENALEDLLKRADKLMYTQKQAKRRLRVA